jgi:hypothetical protein
VGGGSATVFDFFTNASKSLTGKCHLLALAVAIFAPQSINYSP